jgi:RNA polymerase sigma factor (sigma-70 family)
MDDLVANCLRGDQDAWRAFVDRYARVIFAAVRHVLSHRGSSEHGGRVEDVTQEVFLRLVRDDYKLLRAFNPVRATLVTYLTIIARSTALDAVRRHEIRLISIDHAPEPVAQTHDLPDAVDIPQGLLSPRQRLVLGMLFDRQMSVAEAASVLGIDAQTVRSTKHKAISKLRQHFGQK